MEMAGYRRVNYYELCRLCTSSEGTKMHIFREEGRRRSLPNKIHTCLPLTVQEEDSLPKIICSGCVEKLESYYEFRESCINAEAMLESYFTSLRYSDDLSREGKVSVYVKEEPNKKKDENNTKAAKLPTVSTNANSVSNISSVTNVTGVSAVSTSTVNTVNVSTSVPSEAVTIPSAIQILTDQDGNRLAQYKVQLQGGIPSLVPSYPALQVPVPSLQQVKTINVSQDGNQATQTDNSQTTSLVTAVALTPQSHDLFSISSKDRFRAPLAQISDTLKMKNINIIDASLVDQLNNQGTVTGAPGSMQFRIDPEQLQQLMTQGGGLHLNLNTLSAPKPDRNPKEEQSNQADIDLKFEEESEQNLEEEISDVAGDLNDGDGQTFDCDICGKSFRRKEHLFQHKKSHSGQRPFACSMCGKAFSRKEHLLRHKVSHTGQKLYTCDVCQKNFSRKDNLHKHKKTHGINGPHVCEICGKSFVVKHYYTIHKATHTREEKTTAPANANSTSMFFSCDVCEKMFSTKHAMEAHKQRHRTKIKSEEISQQDQQQTQQQPQQQQQQQQSQQAAPTSHQPTIIASFPMATINPQSLLAPNILHAAGNMVQIGNASYVCTELLDQYRRYQAS